MPEREKSEIIDTAAEIKNRVEAWKTPAKNCLIDDYMRAMRAIVANAGDDARKYTENPAELFLGNATNHSDRTKATLALHSEEIKISIGLCDGDLMHNTAKSNKLLRNWNKLLADTGATASYDDNNAYTLVITFPPVAQSTSLDKMLTTHATNIAALHKVAEIIEDIKKLGAANEKLIEKAKKPFVLMASG